MAKSGAAARSLAVFGVAWVLCACGDEPPPQESRTSVPMREMGRKPQPAEPDALDAYHAALAEPVAEPEPQAAQPPRITGVQIDPGRRVTGGQPIRVVAHAMDPEGGDVELAYVWRVNGERQDASGPELATDGLRRGDRVSLEVVAKAGARVSEPVVGPDIEVVNGMPRIVSSPQPPGPDGRFVYQIVADDPDGDSPLRFRLVSGPQGMSVTAAGGLVRWEPRADQAGTHAVEVAVQDPLRGEARQRFELSIDAPAAPGPAAPQR